MQVIQIPAWLAGTNAWILTTSDDVCVIVDAPPEPERIGSVLADRGLSVGAVLLTHGHVDHMGGSEVLASSTGASVYVHPDDDFLTLNPVSQLEAIFGMRPPGEYATPEKMNDLFDGQVLEVAGMSLEVRHTPGHTPGHCCFYVEAFETLLSGDQLFAGSVGRTDFPYGSHDLLMRSMRNKVLTLPDSTRVLPGHGPETTVGRERLHNPFLV